MGMSLLIYTVIIKHRGVIIIKVIFENMPKGCEPEIIIRCYEKDESVLEVVNFIKFSSEKLAGFADSKIHLINLNDVFYFESVDNKVFIYCKEKVYESKLRLYEIESKFKDSYFFRASKSTILNIKKIDFINPVFYGRFEAVLTNGERTIISRQYVPVLKKKLGL